MTFTSIVHIPKHINSNPPLYGYANGIGAKSRILKWFPRSQKRSIEYSECHIRNVKNILPWTSQNPNQNPKCIWVSHIRGDLKILMALDWYDNSLSTLFEIRWHQSRVACQSNANYKSIISLVQPCPAPHSTYGVYMYHVLGVLQCIATECLI